MRLGGLASDPDEAAPSSRHIHTRALTLHALPLTLDQFRNAALSGLARRKVHQSAPEQLTRGLTTPYLLSGIKLTECEREIQI